MSNILKQYRVAGEDKNVRVINSNSMIKQFFADSISHPADSYTGISSDAQSSLEKTKSLSLDTQESGFNDGINAAVVTEIDVSAEKERLLEEAKLEADSILDKAKAEASRLLDEAKQRAQILYADNKSKGYEDGLAECQREFDEKEISLRQELSDKIRDLSRTLNKKMSLVITGEDTELDRTVVDQIGDPLQHLLRNSADHGLESNEVRLERGKPEVGTIFLNAYQEGNNVVIKVGDDGNGIDTEAVKNKAIERGIVTAEQAENLSQKDIINFLFMPSFSMAKQITDISGRGVGLDVVKSGIEQLGGDVSVSTELGKGTTFTVRLPLTLAIIQALMVEIRDEIYAIALGSISNIEDIPVKDIKYVQAKEVIHLRGSVIPIIRLDKMLDIEPKEQEPDHLTVVIVQKGDQQAGLVVDNLIGQQEIVIKSLGKYINGNKLISGATILGDGDVALILDVNTLM